MAKSMDTYIHTCIHTYTHAHMHTCIHIDIHMHTCIHTHTHIYTHTQPSECEPHSSDDNDSNDSDTEPSARQILAWDENEEDEESAREEDEDARTRHTPASGTSVSLRVSARRQLSSVEPAVSPHRLNNDQAGLVQGDSSDSESEYDDIHSLRGSDHRNSYSKTGASADTGTYTSAHRRPVAALSTRGTSTGAAAASGRHADPRSLAQPSTRERGEDATQRGLTIRERSTSKTDHLLNTAPSPSPSLHPKPRVPLASSLSSRDRQTPSTSSPSPSPSLHGSRLPNSSLRGDDKDAGRRHVVDGNNKHTATRSATAGLDSDDGYDISDNDFSTNVTSFQRRSSSLGYT
jgi:hypothetical protein